MRRRTFLKRSAATAIAGSGAFAVNGKMSLLGSALAAKSDYASLPTDKSLVCVFLAGGCDTTSLFLPAEPESLAAIVAARGALTVKPASLLFAGSGNNKLGFNPALPALHSLYMRGDLAVVQNVGNLVAPVTRADYKTNKRLLPRGLFNHADQQDQWFRASSGSRTSAGTGWAGRMADLLSETNQHDTLPLSYSVSSASRWQSGKDDPGLKLESYGLPLLPYLDSSSVAERSANTAREASLNRILAQQHQHKLKQQVRSDFLRVRDSSRALYGSQTYVDGPSELARHRPNLLAADLERVASMIAQRENLGMKRQIFFVQQHGWDTHSDQSVRLEHLMAELDEGLAGFQRSLQVKGLAQSVTTFTASEFGRSLSGSIDGTAHGWGGQYLVMGGAVDGGRLLGSAPSWRLGASDDAGNLGRFIPSTSLNQFAAELARWLGLTQSDINEIFPDLRYFNDTGQLNLFNA